MDRIHEAQRVTWIGFWINLVLSIVKMLAGYFGASTAVLADGVHSLSDFVTDVVVVVFVRVSGKRDDEDHRYGHGKFETFASLLISLALFAVAIGLFASAAKGILAFLHGNPLSEPSWLAFAAAFLSIVSKEWLFRFTFIKGKRINSPAVIANAWHHRSDAFSSIATVLGVGAAILLGGSWRVLDPIAGMLVSLFIIRVAYTLGLPSVQELLEAALPKDVEAEIIKTIHAVPGVRATHRLRTRRIGKDFAIDVHVKLDSDISFIKSHDIATDIERSLRLAFGNDTHLNIHTEPFEPENRKPDWAVVE